MKHILAAIIILFFANVGTIAAQDFRIISPSPGEVIIGDKVEARVKLPAGIALPEYSVKLWLDALTDYKDEIAVVLTDKLEHTFQNVFSGLHRLRAEVFRGNERLSPPILAMVEFETTNEAIKPLANGVVQPILPPTPSESLRSRSKTRLIISFAIALLAVSALWQALSYRRKS